MSNYPTAQPGVNLTYSMTSHAVADRFFEDGVVSANNNQYHYPGVPQALFEVRRVALPAQNTEYTKAQIEALLKADLAEHLVEYAQMYTDWFRAAVTAAEEIMAVSTDPDVKYSSYSEQPFDYEDVRAGLLSSLGSVDINAITVPNDYVTIVNNAVSQSLGYEYLGSSNNMVAVLLDTEIPIVDAHSSNQLQVTAKADGTGSLIALGVERAMVYTGAGTGGNYGAMGSPTTVTGDLEADEAFILDSEGAEIFPGAGRLDVPKSGDYIVSSVTDAATPITVLNLTNGEISVVEAYGVFDYGSS